MGSLLRKIDSYLIANHPHVWLLKLHIVLLISVVMIAVYSAVALLTPLKTNSVPDMFAPRQWFILLPSILLMLWWVFVQGRDRQIGTVDKKKRPEMMLTTIGMTLCLVLLSAPPFAYTTIMLKRISALVDQETIENDVAQLFYFKGLYLVERDGALIKYDKKKPGVNYTQRGPGGRKRTSADEFVDAFVALDISDQKEKEIEETIQGLSVFERLHYLKIYDDLISLVSNRYSDTGNRLKRFLKTKPEPLSEEEWRSAEQLFKTLSVEEKNKLITYFVSELTGWGENAITYLGRLRPEEIEQIIQEYEHKAGSGQPPLILELNCFKRGRTYPVPVWIANEKITADDYREKLGKCEVPRLRSTDWSTENDTWLDSDGLAIAALAIVQSRDHEYFSKLARRKIRAAILYATYKIDLLYKIDYSIALIQKEKIAELKTFLKKYTPEDEYALLTEMVFDTLQGCDPLIKNPTWINPNCRAMSIPRVFEPVYDNIDRIKSAGVYYEDYIVYIGIGVVVCLFGITLLLSIASIVPLRHFLITIITMVLLVVIQSMVFGYLDSHFCSFHDCSKTTYEMRNAWYDMIVLGFLLANVALYVLMMISLNITRRMKKKKFVMTFIYIYTSIFTCLLPWILVSMFFYLPGQGKVDVLRYLVIEDFIKTSLILIPFAGPALYICQAPVFEGHVKRMYTLPE